MAMSEISESGRKRNSERTVRSDGEGAAAGASRRTGGTLALHFLYGRAARFLSALDALLERFAKRGRNLFVLGLGKIPFDAESLLRLVEGFVETGELALHALERFLLLQQFVFRHDGSFG